jgi:acyl carrier protein
MVSERLKEVVLRELRLKDFPIEDATVAGMVPGWDSLNHVRVVLAVETEFKVRFKVSELVRLKSVGDLQELIDRKRPAG